MRCQKYTFNSIRIWVLVLLIISGNVWMTAGCTRLGKSISRDALVADVERLAQIITDAHPDPYERCGGKEAFDAKLAETIASIPEEGMRQGQSSCATLCPSLPLLRMRTPLSMRTFK